MGGLIFLCNGCYEVERLSTNMKSLNSLLVSGMSILVFSKLYLRMKCGVEVLKERKKKQVFGKVKTKRSQ
ncbi:hypothetical protein VNO78_11201 [Psophocarpus tetragonolobus]|uniref:Uncharacterized protein n=1 Tax=Psophocarpus tetragonolobus TaxID=3891 RepID=A0AAN9SST0_PSOTE